MAQRAMLSFDSSYLAEKNVLSKAIDIMSLFEFQLEMQMRERSGLKLWKTQLSAIPGLCHG